MTEKKNKAQVIKKLILKIILRGVLFLLGIFVVLAIAVNLPFVQERLVTYVTNFIMTKAGHRATLEGVKLNWFDTIELNGLVVYDTRSQPMITADKVDLDFHLFQLLADQNINFDKGTLDNARVTMLRNAPEAQFNLTYMIDMIRENLARERRSGRRSKKFIIREIEIINSEFLLDNTGRDSLAADRFDPNHFILKALNGRLNDFSIDKGNVHFGAQDLSCYDSATQFTINSLNVNYQYTRQNMVFQNMELVAGESTIENSMIFEYENPQSLREFVSNVKITANIKKSLVKLNDLGAFIPAVRNYNQYFRLKGYYEGPVTRFNTKNIILEFGQSSRIEGYFSMYGLPNFFETFINANITTAQINTYDLAPYLETEELRNLLKFGKVKFDGRFSGFPHDFVSNGAFHTAIGNFDTDINVKINQQDRDASTYSGNLTTNNLNLGLFLEDTSTYQMLAFEGKLAGKGFTRASADLKVDAKIEKIGYKGYEYSNIVTNAHLTKDFFNGVLKIEDPNLQFDGAMGVDFRNNQNKLVVTAILDTAHLQNLKLSNKKAFIKSELDVSIQGFTEEELVGEASFKNLYIDYDDRQFELEQLSFVSEKDSLGRTLQINSSMLDAFLVGDFKPITFVKDFGGLFYEYWLVIQNNQEKIDAYYAEKNVSYDDYYFLDMELTLKDINSLLHLAEPKLSISKNAEITGSFTSGYSSALEFQAYIENLSYDNVSFDHNSVTLYSTNFADTAQIDARVSLFSKKQRVGPDADFENLQVDIDWHKNKLNFAANVRQFEADNYAKLSGHLDFFPGITKLKFDPSEFKALDKTWTFSDNNEIVLKNKYYEFTNLELVSGLESISLNGIVSENKGDNLFVSIKNLNMDNVNPLISKTLEGSLNGYLDLTDYFGERELNGRINIREFKINELLVGDISSVYSYEKEKERFKTNISLLAKERRTLLIDGFIYPFKRNNQLDLGTDFKNTNLNILEPFYENVISDLDGKLLGKLYIKGSFQKPLISGGGVIEQGIVTLDYQKVRYSFDGEVHFDNTTFDFEHINIRDIRGNRGTLYGTILHNNFKELRYNFTGNFQQFQVLNTQPDDNNLFYGQAYATGNLRIFGEGKNVTFKANAVSNKDTRIYIPLSSDTEAHQEDFIQFVQARDTTSEGAREPYIFFNDPVTLNFDFDFELTPEAYCEIIFDITSGDIIRGRGNGKLKLLASTEGDFEIYGNYDITQGGYNFTMYNIINKEFQIHPDSRITWNGDPYHATLDIKASYRQLTSLLPLINYELESRPTELSRKYPAYVYLFIKGDMLSPEIDFDIELKDYPENFSVQGLALESFVRAFYNKLKTDEQELKKQVFSLIVLKKLSEENDLNVGSALGNSVSEFVSNQLSYWISQVDENLIVDIDYDIGSMSDEEFNTFQLRLSYSLFDGRLRITRDGNYSSRQDYNDPMSIIGDWTLEYLLTEDGKLRAKFYNKTNFNNYFSTINNRTVTSTGFSLMHTQSFDEFFKKVKSKRDEIQDSEKEEDQQKEEEAIRKSNAISRKNEVPETKGR